MTAHTAVCPSCSGCGLLTDGWTEGVAFQRQTSTSEAECPRCAGIGRIPAPPAQANDERQAGVA